MQKVLVIPLTPVIDALVSDLASALAYEPVRLDPHDAPGAAVERLAPVVVFIDVDHPAVRDTRAAPHGATRARGHRAFQRC